MCKAIVVRGLGQQGHEVADGIGIAADDREVRGRPRFCAARCCELVVTDRQRGGSRQ